MRQLLLVSVNIAALHTVDVILRGGLDVTRELIVNEFEHEHNVLLVTALPISFLEDIAEIQNQHSLVTFIEVSRWSIEVKIFFDRLIKGLEP